MRYTKSLLTNLLFFVLCFNLCNCTKTENYTDSLPDNAIAVAKLNVNDIFTKADFAKHPSFTENFKKGLIGDFQGKEKDFIEKILNDPNESGLSFTTPLYIFIDSESQIPGLLSKVENESKVKNLFEVFFATESTTKNGVNIVRTPKGVIAYNANRFIALVSDKVTDQYAADLINKKSDKELSKNAGYTDFQKEKADITMWQSSGDISALLLKMQGKNLNANQFTKGFATNSVITLNFEKGKISINQKTYPPASENTEEYDKLLDALKPINGKLLSKLPEESIFNLGTNLTNLSSIMDAYKSMPQFNEALKSFGSMGINTDSLGNMFNGDILMSLESISNMGFPVFSIIAEVPNNSFMETIFTVTKVFGISFTEVSPGLYTFQNTFYLYSKDGIFIVTSNKAVIDNIDKGFSPSLANAPYAKIYKGTYGAMYIDFKALLAIPMLGADKNPYYKFVSSITDITMTSPKKTESEIFVNFENKDVNALQQILFK